MSNSANDFIDLIKSGGIDQVTRVIYKKKQNNKEEHLLDANLQILFDKARSSGLSCSQYIALISIHHSPIIIG